MNKNKRRGGNTLERWEVALVKAMLEKGIYNDQEILAYFTRPTRSVNHRLIGEIRTNKRHARLRAASPEQLEEFLSTWPDIDSETGLSVRGDELFIKAREAMIAAVQTFNSCGLTFRAELFIVTVIIAWTYLLHAWFKREGINYKYDNEKTRGGADRYWDLGKCLRHQRCPLTLGVVTNLKFLIEIRHEIEHRSTSRIDDSIGAKLQSCALNFNNMIKQEFGAQYGLERRLPLALQFVSFDKEQLTELKKSSGLPKNLETTIDDFERQLTDEQMKDPAYRMSYAFSPITAKKPGTSDVAVTIVPSGSEESKEIGKIIFKEINKERYPAKKVIEKINAEGFVNFKMQDHTKLWQQLEAKKLEKGYGCQGDYKNT